jgi:hypothetical protein
MRKQVRAQDCCAGSNLLVEAAYVGNRGARWVAPELTGYPIDCSTRCPLMEGSSPPIRLRQRRAPDNAKTGLTKRIYGSANAISDCVFRSVPFAPAPLAATIATYCFPLLP